MQEAVAYVNERLAEIAVARALGIRAAQADAGGVTLTLPLASNANDKGTAFAGSLYSVAVLAGWACLHLMLRGEGVHASIVAHETTARYLLPVTTDVAAQAIAPAGADLARVLRTLRRARPARIGVSVTVMQHGAVAVEFLGQYALLPA